MKTVKYRNDAEAKPSSVSCSITTCFETKVNE